MTQHLSTTPPRAAKVLRARPLSPLERAACAGLLTIIGATSMPTPASAQSSAELSIARRHFQAARDFQEKKDWASAAKELRAAIAIKETPGLRYHLAVSEENQSNYVEALLEYDRAAELIELGQKADDVAARLETARERLRKLIGQLSLSLPDAPDLEVFLNGNRLGDTALKSPIPLNPGPHLVEARAPGFEPTQHKLVAVAGRKLEIKLELVPRPVAPQPSTSGPEAPADRPADNTSVNLKLYVLIGEGILTAVGIGMGVGFALQAESAGEERARAQDDINRRAPQNGCDNPDPLVQQSCDQFEEFADQENSARTLSTIGLIGAGAGVVSLVATALFWNPEGASAGAGPLRLHAAPLSGGAFLGLSRQF